MGSSQRQQAPHEVSLRAALAGLWLLILVLCRALAVLMRGLFEQGVGAQLAQGTQKIDRAGQEAARRFERYSRDL